jgi:hypothetical protein
MPLLFEPATPCHCQRKSFKKLCLKLMLKNVETAERSDVFFGRLHGTLGTNALQLNLVAKTKLTHRNEASAV